MSLILPQSYRGRNALQDHLRTRDQRDFEDGVALTAEFLTGLQRVSKARGWSNKDILRAMVTTMASAVQAMAPPDAWSETADILCEELKARLTVEQD